MRIVSKVSHPIHIRYISGDAQLMAKKHGWEVHPENKDVVIIPGCSPLDATRSLGRYEKTESIEGIITEKLIGNDLVNVPTPEEDTIYIVSFMAAQKLVGREDVYCVGKQERGNAGKIKYALGFVKVEH